MERFQRPQLARRARPFLRASGSVGSIRTRGGFRPSYESSFSGRFYGGIGRGRAFNGGSFIGEQPQQPQQLQSIQQQQPQQQTPQQQTPQQQTPQQPYPQPQLGDIGSNNNDSQPSYINNFFITIIIQIYM